MIIYPFVCIPQGWLIDNYSTRLGIIIASGCTLAGSALKMLVNKDTTLAACFVGQFLSGLFQPALLNSPGKIAANWFREDIRTVICTICCLADTVGIFVGFLWNLAFIKENATQDEFKDQVFKYMLSEFILNLVFCLPAFFIFKDKPDIPPSPSQAEDNSEKPDLIKSLKMLFTNIRFIYLLIATLFVVGYYDVMGTIINSLFDMYGVTGQQSSVIYAVSSVAGMISSLVISWLLDKYKKFKLFMIILCLLGTLFQALFTLLLELVESRNLNAYAIGLVLYTLVNMIVVPFYTIGMNYACEITYPVGESINGGIMMTMSQLSGIGGTFLCDHFINNYKEKPWISNVILLIFFVISCVFVFLFDEKLDRQEVEQAGRIKEDEDKKIEPVTVEVQGQSN
jgi:MFS family permease